MARLREIPRNQLDVAQPAAERRQTFHAARRLGRRRAPVERRIENRRAGRRLPQRRVDVQAQEQIRLVVVRDRRALVERDVAVIVSREQDADAEPCLDDPFRAARDGERQILFLRALCAPCPFIVAAVAGIDRDRADRRDRHAERRRQLRRRRGLRCRGRRRRRLGRLCGQNVDRQPHRRIDRLRGAPETGKARTQIDRERGLIERADVLHQTLGALWRERGIRKVEGVDVEFDRQPLIVLRDGAVGGRRRVDCQTRRRGAERVVANHDARHAHVADEEQVRRLAQLEPGVVDGSEGAADEFYRHEPPPSVARQRRRQRDQPARHGRERLVRREDDGPSFVRHRDGAERLLDRETEGRREIVERHEFLIAQQGDRHRAAAVFCEHRQRRRRRGLTRQCGAEPEKHDDGNDGGEKWKRTGLQWRISGLHSTLRIYQLSAISYQLTADS